MPCAKLNHLTVINALKVTTVGAAVHVGKYAVARATKIFFTNK